MNTPEMSGIDLAPIFAPVYWGFVISLLLGGMAVVQAYIYFPSPNDRPIVRLTAGSMLILDIASSVLNMQSIYYYLIPHFGSLVPLGTLIPELSIDCLLSTIMTAISQLYFVYQLVNVKRAGKGSWMLIGVIVFFLLVAFAGGVACVGAMFKFHHGVLANRNRAFAISFGIAKGAGAVTDVLATVAMCLFLSSAKTGMNSTNALLRSLVQFVIHRGVLVTLIQVLLLITFYALPDNLVWFAFHVNVTKLYANTFFAMLNARAGLKEKQKGTQSKMTMGSAWGSWNVHNSDISSHTFHDNERGGRVISAVEESDGAKNESLAMPRISKTVVISEL